MKTLMFYEIAADGLGKVADHYAAHLTRLREFHSRGDLLMAGPYGHPPAGALAVFTNLQAAEEFSSADPFVVNGIVARCTFEEWNETFA